MCFFLKKINSDFLLGRPPNFPTVQCFTILRVGKVVISLIHYIKLRLIIPDNYKFIDSIQIQIKLMLIS